MFFTEQDQQTEATVVWDQLYFDCSVFPYSSPSSSFYCEQGHLESYVLVYVDIHQA